MPKIGLTDLSVRSLKEGLYFDTKTPAFGIRVGKNRKTWLVAIGTRLPAFYTSLGRAQLGLLPDPEILARLAAALPSPTTPRAVIGADALLERIRADHAQGYSLVDEELEKGLRSVAVPIVTRSGENVGAINLSAHSSRSSRNDLRDRFLPKLEAIARQISRTLL